MALMATLPGFLFYSLLFVALYFQVFLLLSFLEVRGRIKEEEIPRRDPESYPSVSIIVPCYNEETTLEKTIASLLSLDYPKERLTLYIVDDGSRDGTWTVAKRLAAEHGITVLKKENGGKHTALNLALSSVTTDLVGCLDADSFVFPETLKTILPYFDDETVMAVTPAIKVHRPQRALELMQHVEYTIAIFIKKMLGTIDAIQVTPGPFSIFRRKVFDNLGPYRKAHNTEDLEIAYRMHHHHYRIVNSHKAFVETVAPSTVRGLYRQRLRWVHGFLENSLDYKHLFFNRTYGDFGMFVLPAAVLSVFSVLYLVGYGLVHSLGWLAGKLHTLAAVGFRLPHLDLFFLNTDLGVILSLILFTLTMVILVIGKRMVEGHQPPAGLVYFFLIYGFIVPSWLFMAVFNTVFSRQNIWR